MELWYWIDLYNQVPVDVFFAAADCIRYIQFVYLAHWIDRKRLIIIVGLWFTLVGLSKTIHATMQGDEDFQMIDFFEPDSATSSEFLAIKRQFRSKAFNQVVCGLLLCAASLAQFKLTTINPVDSGFIVNE